MRYGSVWFADGLNEAAHNFPYASDLPRSVDVAVVGAGLSGLALGYFLKRFNNSASVLILEASHIGAGGSGRTGGIVLNEAPCRPMPGTMSAIDLVRQIVLAEQIDCNWREGGCWELKHGANLRPVGNLHWIDGEPLVAVKEVPGADYHPVRYMLGLADTVRRLGVGIAGNSPVRQWTPGRPHRLTVGDGQTIEAAVVIFATNAYDLHLSRLDRYYAATQTYAVATEPLTERAIDALGLSGGKSFYTLDLPYLWGRTTPDGRLVVGSGLTYCYGDRLADRNGTWMFHQLEARLRRLHPVLRNVRVDYRWTGPICISVNRSPYLGPVPGVENAYVLAGYAGHGVALSQVFAKRIAEVVAGVRDDLGDLSWAGRLPPGIGRGPVKYAAVQVGLMALRLRLPALAED